MTVSDTQQRGPSDTTQIGTEAILERLEALAKEVASLREGNRSRSSTFSASPSVLFVPGANHEKSEAASRSLNAVASVALPEGGVWRGSQDTRSVRRFLDSVSQRVQASGLGPHGAFFYLINKCLSTGLAEELFGQCQATKVAPVDYGEACQEAAEFLMRTFHVTNQPSRFVERLEGLGWAREATNFDEYRQSFYRIMREAHLLEVQMTNDNRRRIFIKGLPEKLRDMIEERLIADEPVEKLIEMIDLWIARKNDNPFSVASRKVVKAASLDLASEKGDTQKPPIGQGGMDGWKPRCFKCGQQGHMKAMCPKRHEKTQGSSQTVSVMAVDSIGPQGSGDASDINWSGASLRLAGAALDKGSPRREVTLTDARGEGVILKQVALLDTGAQVTCCNRAFANRLYKAGVVKDTDIKKGYEGYMVMADDETQVKPLGTVRVVIEGAPVDMVVIPVKLCADLIVGFDQLTTNRKLRDMLVRELSREGVSQNEFTGISGKDPKVRALIAVQESAEETCGARENFASEETGPVKDETDKDRTHCEWPPVELRWRDGALEALRPNVSRARGEAKQLELRMTRKCPWMLVAYRAVIDEWVRNGWLEAVEDDKVKFCLRHFGVEKDRNGATAMSRCRLVVNGKELTPLLQVPRCTHTDMVHNLLVWRSAQVFAVLDISQAYMRIALSEKDSYYLCICWGGRFYRFKSIPMGIAPSAQILQTIVDSYVTEFSGEQSLEGICVGVVPYMDDLVACGWSARELSEERVPIVVQELEGSLKQFLESKRMKVSESKTLRPDSDSGTLLGVRFSQETISPSSKLVKLARGELMEIARRPMTRRQAVAFFEQLLRSIRSRRGSSDERAVTR